MNNSSVIPFPQRDSNNKPTSRERITPQALEGEQSTIGSMLMDRDAIQYALDVVSVEDFYRELHRKIFIVIVCLFSKGDPVDLITVVEELRRRNQLDEVGGPAYLTALVESCPSSANVESYAKVVKEKSMLRQLLSATEKISGMVYNEDDSESVTQLLDKAEALVIGVGQSQLVAEASTLGELIEAQRMRIASAAINPEEASGYMTGLLDLDTKTNGLKPSQLIIVAGRPAMGKSAFASQIATYISEKYLQPVIIFSLEMSKDQWVTRMAASQARINSRSLERGELTSEEWERLDIAQEELLKLPMHIFDTPAMKTSEIRAHSRRIAATHGTPALIVIDYLTKARPPQHMPDIRTRTSAIVSSFKDLAKEIKCPVICLSQLSRSVEQREIPRPVMSDLMETGSIEAEADVVALLYRPSYYAEKKGGAGYTPTGDEGFDECIIGKQREGETGTVFMKFIGQYTRFESAVKHY